MLTIYKSSAGSGKTYTLVLEYLKIVILDPLAYRQVLAVTFTNKATGEMKVRIVEALSKLATSSEAELKRDSVWVALNAYLLEKGKPDLSVSLQARKVLELILNDYSNFSVSTIESFFQRIVRAFARELNIPLGYDVEMKQDIVLQRVVSDLLMEAGNREGLTKLLNGFVERNLEEEKTWNVDVEIRALGTEIFKERFQQLLVDFPEEGDRLSRIMELIHDLLEIRFKFENTFADLSAQALKIMDQFGLSFSDFAHGKGGVGAFILRFLKKVDPEDYMPTKRAEEAYENPEKWYAKSSDKKQMIIGAVQAGLENILAKMISLYETRFEDYNTAIQVLRTIHSFGLLDELQNKLADYRRENAQLIISDTTFLLSNVVGSQYDAPFIYEKVGSRYRHYLVDEFQDTSDMQWYNLLPLVREALSQGRNSLIVGDVKQSIYRWRNGNMRLLLDVVEAEMSQMGQEVKVRQLDDNYRTGAEIVRFNNRFFQEAENYFQELYKDQGDFLFRLAYSSVSQNPKKHQVEGFVNLEFFSNPGKDAPEKSPSWQEQSMTRTLEVILELYAEGFRGGDITILVRTNFEGMKLAEFLQKSGIKVISAESLLVVSNKKVLLLQALLQHLNHEQDEIVKASLAYYYSRVVLDTKETNSLFANSEFVDFNKSFIAEKQELRRLSVYECVERLIRLFPVLSQPDAYVQGFLDTVLEYTETNDASISGFLEWWEEIRAKRAIASAPEPEAVQIMTIHKCKGLEFPVVLIPFADWKMEPNLREILWVKPEYPPYNKLPFLPVRANSKLEQTKFAEEYIAEKLATRLDNLNLMYVAFTRPVYRLYVFTRADSSEKASSVGSLINLLVNRQVVEGVWNETQTRFTVGKPEKFKPEPDENPAHSIPLAFSNLNLLNRSEDIQIRYTSNRFLKSGTITRNEKITTGELVHEALSLLKTSEDIPFAVKRMLDRGFIPSSESVTLARQLEKIVLNDSVKHWFNHDWEIKNEAEMVTSEGKVLRPDRVMLKGKAAMIVDYKTGQPNTRHNKQVREYVSALEEMGYFPVNGYVYYLNPGIVEEV
ncbi:MAG: UvrD-helicase domain-containing protein [Bacteroidia bacterium]|nr:UvrD-helicase domain-containing protein [Bacteroidia bacterium]